MGKKCEKKKVIERERETKVIKEMEAVEKEKDVSTEEEMGSPKARKRWKKTGEK